MHGPRRVVVNLVVEGARAQELEGDQQEGQGSHGVGVDVVAVAAHPGDQEDDQIGQHGGEDVAVEEHAPEHAARLGLGDEDVHEQILLEPDVNAEVERGGGQHQRLDRSVAEGDGGVEEEVVVVAGVVEGRRGGQLDQLARGGAGQLAHQEAVEQRPQLGQVDGGAQLALQQPGDPEGGDAAQRDEDGLAEVLLDDGLPGVGARLGLVDDAGHEAPDGAEHREDDQVVEDEERV
ncbi:hypothetical protein VTK73DRAFT_9932 [Phialemonium thermophilum]|uniref:Uncharacterized protein n=1 Tax=Phialemonium thermophilum TaxID=223376 RepID=A0ABR3VZC5_9PEZI